MEKKIKQCIKISNFIKNIIQLIILISIFLIAYLIASEVFYGQPIQFILGGTILFSFVTAFPMAIIFSIIALPFSLVIENGNYILKQMKKESEDKENEKKQ